MSLFVFMKKKKIKRFKKAPRLISLFNKPSSCNWLTTLVRLITEDSPVNIFLASKKPKKFAIIPLIIPINKFLFLKSNYLASIFLIALYPYKMSYHMKLEQL